MPASKDAGFSATKFIAALAEPTPLKSIAETAVQNIFNKLKNTRAKTIFNSTGKESENDQGNNNSPELLSSRKYSPGSEENKTASKHNTYHQIWAIRANARCWVIPSPKATAQTLAILRTITKPSITRAKHDLTIHSMIYENKRALEFLGNRKNIKQLRPNRFSNRSGVLASSRTN